MSDHYEPEMADPGEGDMFGAFEAAVQRASERVCLVCGLLDSEGGCDHRGDCKRPAEVVTLEEAERRLASLASREEDADGR